MDIVETFLHYRTSSDVKTLITSDVKIEQMHLNVIVIEILAWLKLEHKRSMWMKEGKKTTLKPLKINMDFPWCISLSQLVEKEQMFQKYFKIENGGLSFSDSITEQERRVIREKAYRKYIPQKNS